MGRMPNSFVRDSVSCGGSLSRPRPRFLLSAAADAPGPLVIGLGVKGLHDGYLHCFAFRLILGEGCSKVWTRPCWKSVLRVVSSCRVGTGAMPEVWSEAQKFQIWGSPAKLPRIVSNNEDIESDFWYGGQRFTSRGRSTGSWRRLTWLVGISAF
jgi:hypothetical protein